MQILDTDVLGDVLRRRMAAAAWLRRRAEQPSVPGFVVMELVRGRSDKADLRRAQSLARLFPIFWPSEADCVCALTDDSALRLSSGLSVLNTLFAVTAAGRSAALVTFSPKHCFVVPGLATESSYARS